jgi:hypothetical protein
VIRKNFRLVIMRIHYFICTSGSMNALYFNMNRN